MGCTQEYRVQVIREMRHLPHILKSFFLKKTLIFPNTVSPLRTGVYFFSICIVSVSWHSQILSMEFYSPFYPRLDEWRGHDWWQCVSLHIAGKQWVTVVFLHYITRHDGKKEKPAASLCTFAAAKSHKPVTLSLA